jgi:hypothetical protein
VVILGANNPCVVDRNSKTEEACGVIVVLLIPTPWENSKPEFNSNKIMLKTKWRDKLDKILLIASILFFMALS